MRRYLAEIGTRGGRKSGRKSGRTPDPEVAREMMRAREAQCAERLAMLASLSAEAWLQSGEPLPNTARAQLPVTFRPLRAPRADT